MIIKNKEQRRKYQQASQISTEILRQLYETVAIGVTGLEIDKLAADLCQKYGVEAAFFDVPGKKGVYGHSTCVQINDAAVHGLPDSQAFRPGDLITVDFGIKYAGFYTDHCFSVGLQPVKDSDLKLLKTGKDSVQKAIKEAVTGKTTGDIGYVLHHEVKKEGFDTLKQYIGHGIGQTLHEDPEVAAWGERGEGEVLQKGQVICVESQVVAGSDQIKIDADGWTARTRDGQNSVMFEYMVVVDNAKPKVLTNTLDWKLTK